MARNLHLTRRRSAIGITVLTALCLLGFGGWLISLPPDKAASAPPPVPQAETDALLEMLKPKGDKRPLIAIIGLNNATETTDYLLPASILRRAGIADVMLVATAPGPVRLYPALWVQPDATLTEFDTSHPQGADYVIVPAMSNDNDPSVLAWLRHQADKGAIVIGICAGAKVVAAAGLLDGKRATTHWYYRHQLLNIAPTITLVPDRRLVADRKVVTTTGITASLPMALTLIEAIAGRPRAQQVAGELGMTEWDSRHDSAAFRLSRPFAITVLRNRLAFWSHERLGLQLRPGMDEASLALVADLWSRTYRSKLVTFAETDQIVTANGIRVFPDRVAGAVPGQLQVSTSGKPIAALNQALSEVATRYGPRTVQIVAMQLEYSIPHVQPP